MIITVDNCTIIHKKDDLYSIEIYIDETHKIHASLALDDCKQSRDNILGMIIEKATIYKDGEYFRIRTLLDCIIGISTLTEESYKPITIPTEFHTEKLNLGTAVKLYDKLVGNY